MRKRRLHLVAVLALATLVGVVGVTSALGDGLPGGSNRSAAVAATPADWPQYLLNVQHHADNFDAAGITPANASSLVQKWSWRAPSHSGRPAPRLYASPVAVGGNVYIGARDGFFYKLSQSTGQVLATHDLGYVNAGCGNAGISSTATVVADPSRGGALTVYVTAGIPGGASGGVWLWALDAGTLATVKRVKVDGQAGAYAWASPTFVNGHIYVGVGSQCDSPLARGAVREYSQSGLTLLHTYWTVPATTTSGAPNVGGTVWTTPAATPDGASIFATTGNADEETPGAQPGRSYSIVRLDGNTLAELAHYTVPGAFTAQEDLDFGGSPTTFSGLVNGTTKPLVGACDKDGYYYAFNRDTLTLAWKFKVSRSASEPLTGLGCLSSAAWDSTRNTLFISSEAVDSLDGQSPVYGSIRALSPAATPTNRVLWDNALPCGSITGPALDGAGVLAVATWKPCQSTQTTQPRVFLYDTTRTTANSNGRPDAPRLKSFSYSSPVYAQPVFACSTTCYLLVATSGDDQTPQVNPSTLYAYAPS
jgi:outer membrane protein assembly factor BamB